MSSTLSSATVDVVPFDDRVPGPRQSTRYTPEMRFSQHPFAGYGENELQGSCEIAALLGRSAMSWFDGRLDMGMHYAVAATDAACVQSHELCQLAPLWRVGLLIKARELEAGWRVLNAVESRTRESGSQRMMATSHAIRGELLFAMGSVDDGIAELNVALRIAERCDARSLRPTSYVVMALGALRQADMRACLEFVDKLADEALLGYFGQAAGAWITAQAMEARSGVDSVAGLIAGIVKNPHVLPQLLVSEPAAASWLVRAASKLGAHDLARTVVSAASLAAVKNPQFTVIRSSALHAAGLWENDIDKLREAADIGPDLWCRASVREDLASLLGEHCSERDDTIRLLESALGLYSTVGATRDASRVVNKLRDFGVRRGAIRTVEREGQLPHGLTKTEFAVAELTSQGHTNKEVGRQLFISRHTVAFHLKKVYSKMNLTSRVELAATWKVVQ